MRLCVWGLALCCVWKWDPDSYRRVMRTANCMCTTGVDIYESMAERVSWFLITANAKGCWVLNCPVHHPCEASKVQTRWVACAEWSSFANLKQSFWLLSAQQTVPLPFAWRRNNGMTSCVRTGLGIHFTWNTISRTHFTRFLYSQNDKSNACVSDVFGH